MPARGRRADRRDLRVRVEARPARVRPTASARWRARTTRASGTHRRRAERRGSPPSTLDRAETSLRRVCWCKRALVRSSRRLVLSAIEERAGVRVRAPAREGRPARAQGRVLRPRAGRRSVRSHKRRTPRGPRRRWRSDAPSRGSTCASSRARSPPTPGAKLDEWTSSLIEHQPQLLPPEIIASLPSVEGRGGAGAARRPLRRAHGAADDRRRAGARTRSVTTGDGAPPPERRSIRVRSVRRVRGRLHSSFSDSIDASCPACFFAT